MGIVGKRILITGSTDGVGKLTACKLAKEGARILLHGRDPEKGKHAAREVSDKSGSAAVEYFNADLSSLDDVRRLAAGVLERHRHLDVVINNAGIGFGARDQRGREASADGYELRFAVNYLSHFLLTELLLPALRAGAPSRLVNVSSAGQAPISFDDLMLTRAYDGARAYMQSKLAQVLFTFELAGRVRDSGVSVFAVHPATLMNTKMVTQEGIKPTSTVEEGADAIVYVATASELDGSTGLYFNGKREARAIPQAYDVEARRRLWEVSERLVRVAPEGRSERGDRREGSGSGDEELAPARGAPHSSP